MKTLSLLTIAFLHIAMLSCKGSEKEGKEYDNKVNQEINDEINKKKEETISPKILAISLSSKNKSKASGNVTFTEEDGVVTMTAYLKGLSAGEYTIHIYAKSDYSSDDEKWEVTKEYHKGGIGNFNATEDGKGSVTFATNEWCIGCEDDKKNIVGRAIVVLQKTDDYDSQPSETVGSKVSCGGIIK